MSKTIKKLEKENTSWKGKHEQVSKSMFTMAEEVSVMFSWFCKLQYWRFCSRSVIVGFLNRLGHLLWPRPTTPKCICPIVIGDKYLPWPLFSRIFSYAEDQIRHFWPIDYKIIEKKCGKILFWFQVFWSFDYGYSQNFGHFIAVILKFEYHSRGKDFY